MKDIGYFKNFCEIEWMEYWPKISAFNNNHKMSFIKKEQNISTEERLWLVFWLDFIIWTSQSKVLNQNQKHLKSQMR